MITLLETPHNRVDYEDDKVISVVIDLLVIIRRVEALEECLGKVLHVLKRIRI